MNFLIMWGCVINFFGIRVGCVVAVLTDTVTNRILSKAEEGNWSSANEREHDIVEARDSWA